MDCYVVHIDNSTLRVGLYAHGQNPKFLAEDLLPTVASHSRIVDPKEFGLQFSRLLAENFGHELPKLPALFVLEPELTDLFLLALDKNTEENSEEVVKQIKEKLIHEDIQNIFFSYYRIAPFVFQFVGIQKETIQGFLDAVSTLAIPLTGVFPLGLILPKTNTNVASMFIFPAETENTVVFSELTGTSFAEKLEGKIAIDELIKLFWQLSVYSTKNTGPTIYTFKNFVHKIPSYKPRAVEMTQTTEGYEKLQVTKDTIAKNPQLLTSQANLLNILSVPQSSNKKIPVPAVIAAGVVSILAMVLVVLQFTVGIGSLFTSQEREVLADQTAQNQDQTKTEVPQQQEEQPAKELKRSDIKLRVENGNGVPGSAGKLKAYLEGFGYTVASVGNAVKTDYPSTTILLPNSLADYKDLLANDLKTNYTVEVTATDTKADGYDVLIIVGAK
ncbi:MAG: hypothetical protein UW65_C0019G0004 [candidate division WWE3 bacterium GW2011_GWB1_44_4]|uniref:LytR/CpsA/Psr regulator C-terminal domain-containing protein n=1 Tax=candidate division WWE3 bacterium GW2011_GWB1_44_4 TaxID=1619116 RepID=A0A0G1LLF0_UNCKA|nr:MAG: hypothetical protein UW65_C0019G0004 [candidate division WWE3 bacterium GW2011_GWB1_44_4]